MALTIKDFIGFETGDLVEASSITGTPDATEATVVHEGGGSRALKLPSGGAHQYAFEAALLGGAEKIIGFWFRTNDTTPAADVDIFKATSGGSDVIIIRWTTDGNLSIVDSGGTVRGTATTPFSNDTYHLIELFWEESDSGDATLAVDTSNVASTDVGDFEVGDTPDTFEFNQVAGNTTSDIYIDDFYAGDLVGATPADMLGGWVVKAFQSTDVGDTDQGDQLAGGTWALVSETPGVESDDGSANAHYENTGNLAGSTICDGGDRAGPSGDADITGDIKAAKWIGNFKRGTGGGRTHEFWVGNDADWITTPTTKTVVTLSLSTDYAITEKLLITFFASVPTTSDFFQHGFSKSATAGQDISCAEIWAMLGYVPAAAGGEVAVGTAGETDLAFALGRLKELGLTLGAETDSALGVGVVKGAVLGTANETDTAPTALTWTKVRGVGVAGETDTAFTLSWTKVKGIGVAGETDSALAMAVVKSAAVGAVGETDTAFVLTWTKVKAIGVAGETDTAFAVSASRARLVGVAGETDTAITISWTKAKGIGTAGETDTAFVLTWAKVKGIGIAGETDSAPTVRPERLVPITLALELDTPFAVTWTKVKALGIAGETDTAQGITTGISAPLGTAPETDTALVLGLAKARLLGIAAETDSAPAIQPEKLVSISLAGETDTALAIPHSKAVLLGIAAETDLALVIIPVGGAAPAPAAGGWIIPIYRRRRR